MPMSALFSWRITTYCKITNFYYETLIEFKKIYNMIKFSKKIFLIKKLNFDSGYKTKIRIIPNMEIITNS